MARLKDVLKEVDRGLEGTNWNPRPPAVIDPQVVFDGTVLMDCKYGSVLHDPTPLCPGGGAHHWSSCPEFEPVRPGFEPPPEPLPHPIRKWQWNYVQTGQWETFFMFRMNAYAFLNNLIQLRP